MSDKCCRAGSSRRDATIVGKACTTINKILADCRGEHAAVTCLKWAWAAEQVRALVNLGGKLLDTGVDLPNGVVG
jgi:hypothetical protein